VNEGSFEVRSLTDLDLAKSFKETLKTCLDDDIPVYIVCPETVTLWAIPDSFNQSIEDFKLLETCNYNEANFQGKKNLSRNKAKGSFNLLERAPTLIEEDIVLLKLSTKNINQLIMLGNCKLTKCEYLYIKGNDELYSLLPSVEAKGYCKEQFFPESHKSGLFGAKQPLWPEFIPIRIDSLNFSFIVCEEDTLIKNFDDPINDKTHFDIKYEDCFVSYECVKKLTEFHVDDIDVESPYYLPKNCRNSSKLNQLAILGHRVFCDKTIEAPKVLKHLVISSMNYLDNSKEAATAAFFITPTPKGSIAKAYRGKTQFSELLKAYQEFCISKPVSTIDDNKNEIDTFFNKRQYSQQNVDLARNIINPDLFNKS